MKTKAFDCVGMKHEIQQRLHDRQGESSWQHRNQAVRELLACDRYLSHLLAVRGLQPQPGREEGGLSGQAAPGAVRP